MLKDLKWYLYQENRFCLFYLFAVKNWSNNWVEDKISATMTVSLNSSFQHFSCQTLILIHIFLPCLPIRLSSIDPVFDQDVCTHSCFQYLFVQAHKVVKKTLNTINLGVLLFRLCQLAWNSRYFLASSKGELQNMKTWPWVWTLRLKYENMSLGSATQQFELISSLSLSCAINLPASISTPKTYFS